MPYTAWDRDVVLPLLRACKDRASRADIRAAVPALPDDTATSQLHALTAAGLIDAGPGEDGYRYELTVAGKARLVTLNNHGQQTAA